MAVSKSIAAKFSILHKNCYAKLHKNAQKKKKKTYGVKATQDESDAICIGSHYTQKNAQADNIVDGGFSWSI